MWGATSFCCGGSPALPAIHSSASCICIPWHSLVVCGGGLPPFAFAMPKMAMKSAGKKVKMAMKSAGKKVKMAMGSAGKKVKATQPKVKLAGKVAKKESAIIECCIPTGFERSKQTVYKGETWADLKYRLQGRFGEPCQNFGLVIQNDDCTKLMGPDKIPEYLFQKASHFVVNVVRT